MSIMKRFWVSDGGGDAKSRKTRLVYLETECTSHTLQANLTLNVGTAAYMAPELGKADALEDEISDEDSGGNRDGTSLDDQVVLNGQDSQETGSLGGSPLPITALANLRKSDNNSVSSYASTGNASARSSPLLSRSSRHLKALPEMIYKGDCFAYGMLLWAMLSWKLPFDGNTQFQILSAIGVHNKRPSTKAIAKKWPSELIALVKALWSRRPSDRPTITEAKAGLVSQIDVMESINQQRSAQTAGSIVDTQSSSGGEPATVMRL